MSPIEHLAAFLHHLVDVMHAPIASDVGPVPTRPLSGADTTDVLEYRDDRRPTVECPVVCDDEVLSGYMLVDDERDPILPPSAGVVFSDDFTDEPTKEIR